MRERSWQLPDPVRVTSTHYFGHYPEGSIDKGVSKSTMTSKEIIDAHIETATVSAGSARAKRSSNDSSNSAPGQPRSSCYKPLSPPSGDKATQSGADVLLRLIDHGCKDLSDSADISSFGEYPISTGGFSDVYCGRMLDGTKVAMKLLRVSVHSLGQNPKHLKCVQICEGLSYLHEIGIVHGDMKGPNVLIADDGTAVLSDFGNAFLKDQTMKFTPTTSASGMSIRWSAPEIINGERPSKGIGCICTRNDYLRGYIWEAPIREAIRYCHHFVVTVRKALPERPECLLMGHNEAEKLWKLLLRCWSEQEARPTAAEVAREMKTIALDNLPTPPPRPISPSYEFPRRD
ncbi:Protein tyrosine kinase [Rhizoctonia solani]|uniref:Protein tyrosine kinase n=1 Tax=Rhizoctonia solani TaxID=456999 RepID=A0A8H7IBM3_9AGAM|nr:Protein tyrosine kinase [Rhizoctonia solani]